MHIYPEQAVDRLERWAAQTQKALRRAEEKVALWQNRYETL